MRTKRELLVRLTLLALVFAIQLLAQGDRGTITGTVRDASGAVVPGAPVTAIQRNTNASYKTTTSTAGDFTVPSLPVGTYQVRVEKQGFKTHITGNVVITPGDTVRVDVPLEVGQAQQSVEVTAAAQLVQSENARVSTQVSSMLVDALPVEVNGTSRSPFDLAATTGEVNAAGTFRIGGGNDTVGVTLDGSSLAGDKIGNDAGDGGAVAMNSPSVEALTEFNVESSGFKAETGNASGGTLSFVSKSGTNQFHGSAFEFLRNQDLDAKGFFNSVRPIYKQNNFGVTAGGPVYLPKLYNGKNKTFFFFSYEGDRKRNYTPAALRTLPTTAFKNGDFSALLDPSFTGNSNSGTAITDGDGNPAVFGAIYDPHSTTQLPDGSYTRTPFPGNIIPTSDISKVSANILKLAPIPNPLLSTMLRNYPGVANQPFFDLNTYGGKLDHVINAKHRMAVFVNSNERLRYNGAGHGYEPIPGSATGYFAVQDILGTMIRATEDWVIGPTFLNHFGFGYNRLNNANSSVTFGQDWPSKIGLQGVAETTFPLINFTGTSYQGGTLNPLGRNNAGVSPNGSYIVQNDTTWIHGKHNIRFGAEVRKYYYHEDDRGGTSGTFTFSPDQTADPSALASTGNAFASFLLGAPYSTGLGIAPVNPTSHFWNPALYVADDWKVSRRLTLNVGLRWDIVGALTEDQHLSSGLGPATPNAGADGYPGALVFLSNLHRSSFQNTYFGELGPRFGFAYQVNSRMVLRGGYGIMYSPPIANAFGLASIDGYNGSNGFHASTRNPVMYWDNGYPAFNFTLPNTDPTLDNGQGIAYIPSNSNRQPYSQNYTLGIQFLLPKNTTLMTSYVGNKGTRLGASGLNNLNQLNPKYLSLGDELLDDVSLHPNIPLPYPSFSGSVAQALLPYPQYAPGGVYYFFPYFGTSHYNAAQVVVNHRTGKGLSFLVSYAFQKTISLTDSNLYGYTNGSQDVYNRKLERSVAGFDHPQQLKVTWIYELPFGRGRQFLNRGGVVNQILGGWTATGIQTYQSGDPLSINSGIDTSGYLFDGNVRGNVISGVPLKVPSGSFDYAGGTGQAYLNPAAFAEPPTTPNGVVLTLGNSPRYFGNLRGPWQPMENFGFFKRFPFREGMFLEFRCDLINAFNRAGRADPDTTLSDSTFGRILDVADGPREVQLALRFTF